LFDALDYKLLPSGFYLQNFKDAFVLSDWKELRQLPVTSVLNGRLRQMGVPNELREIVHGYWIVENQYGPQL